MALGWVNPGAAVAARWAERSWRTSPGHRRTLLCCRRYSHCWTRPAANRFMLPDDLTKRARERVWRPDFEDSTMRNPQVEVVNHEVQCARYPIVSAALALLSGVIAASVRVRNLSGSPVQVANIQLSAGPITPLDHLAGAGHRVPGGDAIRQVSGYLKSIAVDKGDRVAAGPCSRASKYRSSWLPAKQKRNSGQHRRLQPACRNRCRSAGSGRSGNGRPGARAIEVARANFDQSETLSGYATITAPSAASLRRRGVDPGALIQGQFRILV